LNDDYVIFLKEEVANSLWAEIPEGGKLAHCEVVFAK
jgi:hypothetical protein